MALHDITCETTETTGTADVVLTGAAQGCNTWDDAGTTNGESVKYAIVTYDLTTHRPTGRETGTGNYTTSTKTITRTTVHASTNGGSKISLTGLSEVSSMPFSSDIGGGGGGSAEYASYYQNTSHTIANNTDGQTVEIDTELVDDSSLASVASNTITFDSGSDGDYEISMNISIIGGAALNGRFSVYMDTTYTSLYKKTGYATADGIQDDIIYVQGFSQITAGDTITITADNHTGTTVTYQIDDLTFTKLA